MAEAEIGTEVIVAKLADEKKTGELLPLPRGFYAAVERSFTSMGTGSVAELQNRRTALNALKAKRTQKLLIYLAYGKTPPEHLPPEEDALYQKLLSTLNSGEAALPKTRKIKILIKIPEVITNKGRKLGPYQEGEIVQPDDPDDAEFIINNKIGELVG